MPHKEIVEGLFYKDPYIVYLSEIDTEYSGSHYEIGYVVMNTSTGVVEFQTPSFPDALSMANQSAAALVFFMSGKENEIDTSIFDDEAPEETIH
jgi:hypothetical protein